MTGYYEQSGWTHRQDLSDSPLCVYFFSGNVRRVIQ